MGDIQGTYDRYHARGAVGAPATTERADYVSGVASEDIAYGLAVEFTAENVAAIADGTGTFAGIASRRNFGTPTPVDAYPAQSDILIQRTGVVWVQAKSAVTFGQAAAILDATGELVATGTADSTDIPGARFESAGALNDIVKLRLG